MAIIGLQVKFDSLPLVGDALVLKINNGNFSFDFSEIFLNLRTRAGQATIGGTNEINAINLDAAINLDSSNFPLKSRVVGDTITIDFSNDEYYFVSYSGSLTKKTTITEITVPGERPTVPKTLNFTGFSENESPCENVNAGFNATGANPFIGGDYLIYVDSVLIAQQEAPLNIPLKRGVNNVISVYSADSNTFIGILFLRTPRKLLISEVNLSIVNLDSGTTVEINVPDIFPNESFTYSLDGVSFQEQNVYAGLASGTYSVYVKDYLGCVTEKVFVVDGVTEIAETVFTISELNAIRFSRFNNEKKNYINTLSFNELRLVKYPYYQKYLATDFITTQFKTNAQYINVFTIDKELNTSNLTAYKVTNNVGLQAKSTATYFDIGDGKSAIYFGAVTLLDPITSEVIGDENFGSILPAWAKTEGSYVNIQGIGQVKIDKVGYSEFYESFIIEFNIAYTDAPVTKNVSAVYNLQPYDVYEFYTDMSEQSSEFNIVIETGIDENNIDFTFVSEKIKIVEDSEFLFEIDYYMKDGVNVGDMVYQTGIKHKLRLEGNVQYIGEQLTEGYDGDKEYYVTDNTVYNSERFSFYRLSNQVAHKLRLVMAHTYLSINGVQYKLSESPEIPTSDGNSNLRNFFVTLKSGGNILLSDSQQELDNTAQALEIEALITAIRGQGGLLWTKTAN